MLVQALLLYRNYFYSGGNGNKALGSVTLLVITSAIGFGLAAVITPQGVKRLTKDQWIALWLLAGGVVVILLGPTFDKYTYLVLGFALGLSAQCVKICVDTTVQETVDDAYMGRVFSLYDMLYNVAYVAGPAIAIPFLPRHRPVLPGDPVRRRQLRGRGRGVRRAHPAGSAGGTSIPSRPAHATSSAVARSAPSGPSSRRRSRQELPGRGPPAAPA